MNVNDLMNRYDRGRLSRRELLQALALIGLASSAEAQAQSPAVPRALLNHLQLRVNDPAASRDFYSKLFGVQRRPGPDDPNRVSSLVAGAGFVFAKASGRTGIDHYGVGVEPFDAKRVEASIKQALPNSDAQAADAGDNVAVHDPDGILVQITSKTLYQA